jgi:hypothetical protein
MKYYKDADNQVYAYESDGSQDEWIKPGLTAITEAEADALRFPPLTPAELAKIARAKRDALIAACDYTMLPDYPIDNAGRAAWAAYRQALRDITGQAGFPLEIDWPEAPA